jgi:D-alanine--poly(phosphoribitol) ligase subunit 1
MNFSFEKNCFVSKDIDANKTAIIASDITLTWVEFENQVNKLISLLEKLTIKKGEPIIIYGHKEASMLISKVAILKFGAVYVPSDIIFPENRIKMMKEECGSSVLINCTNYKLLENQFDTIINLPAFEVIKNERNIVSVLENKLDPQNPISYVLFTSGSTGRPKGVPIARKGVEQFANWISADFNITKNDVLLNISSLSFDFASFDEYLFLSLGATIINVPSDTIKNSELFLEKIVEQKPTVWISTPGLAYIYLMDSKFNSNHLPSIKSFVFAGESLPLRTYQQLRLRFPDAFIWNAFGPSEATNLTTSISLTDELIQKYNAIPIGYPKPQSNVFIFDEDSEGVGEICIVGDHLTPGYLNNELLNSEKFVQINHKRTYKTGDQGYTRDGLLFYSGRNDDMVKLHGYRIELEDITSTIKDFPGVKNASTIGLKNKGETKKLISFFTSDNEIRASDLLLFCKSKLPEYMLPSEIIKIDQIPLNTSDKVDKKQLETIYLTK